MRVSSPAEGRPWLLLYALLCGGSVALALALALAHSVGAFGWPPAAELDGSGWRRLFTTLAYWRALGYSAALTVVTLTLAVSLALLLLASIGRHLRGGVFARVLLLPLAIPPVVAALMAFMLLGDSGWLSRLCHALGLCATPADFPTLIFDPAGRGIVLTHLVMSTPLFVLLFDNLATHLRLSLLMAQAAALGARPVQAWRRIAVPLLLREARPVLAVYALALFGAYELPLLIGAAQPTMVTVAIARAVAGYDLAQAPFGYAMASGYLLLVLAAWALLARHGTARPGQTP